MMETITPKALVAALKKAGKTISSAESCTGGLIAKRITDVSGSSAVFHGGVVSYVNAVKHVVLGVSDADLTRCGAVSEPVARQMAQGARLLLAVSTTGVAGPDRDDHGNEVGTVYIALADEKKTWCYLCHFSGTRSAVRTAAAQFAVNLAGKYLAGGALSEDAL